MQGKVKVLYMKSFKVNEENYMARQFDFNMICELEEMGVSLDKMQTSPLSAVRAYFALCAGRDLQYAGDKLEEHMLNGGNFDEIVVAMSDALEKSDFFRNLSKKTEANVTKSKAKEK